MSEKPKKQKPKKTNEAGEKLVFTPYIRLKNGKILYAKDVGKKVFCFPDRRGNKDKKAE